MKQSSSEAFVGSDVKPDLFWTGYNIGRSLIDVLADTPDEVKEVLERRLELNWKDAQGLIQNPDISVPQLTEVDSRLAEGMYYGFGQKTPLKTVAEQQLHSAEP
jgi:hypothetical protein